MRNLVICVFMVQGFLAASLAGAAEWHTAVVDYTYLAGVCNSIVVDSQDKPHIAYTVLKDAVQDILRYASWTGLTWNIYDVCDFDDDYIYYGAGHSVSVALDSQGLPYILYLDYDSLMYARWDGTAWYMGKIDQTVTDNGVNNSIVIDSQGHPHISYDSNEGLKYCYWTGSQWQIQIVDRDILMKSSNSMALDSQGYPHIAYFVGNPYWDLRYAHWNGSEWIIQTIDQEFSTTPVVSLATDPQDNLHISCNFNPKLTYTWWDGTSWMMQIVDNTESSWDYGYIGNSIAMDNQNHPAIAYTKYAPNGNILSYAHWNGSSWDVQQVSTDSEWVQMCNLAFKSDGSPIISYFNYADNTMLKIAWYGDFGEYPNVAITLQDFSARSCDDGSITLDWSVETTEGEQILGYNLYRCLKKPEEEDKSGQSNNMQNWNKVNSELIVGRNPYVYVDNMVESGIHYQYRLEAVLTDESKTVLGSCQATAKLPNSFAITKVYPNPADNYLTCALCVPKTGKINFAIYDLSGRTVLEQDFTALSEGNFDVQLGVGQLSPGLYIIGANQIGIMTTARLVVAR
jgi:hypothetical protein